MVNDKAHLYEVTDNSMAGLLTNMHDQNILEGLISVSQNISRRVIGNALRIGNVFFKGESVRERTKQLHPLVLEFKDSIEALSPEKAEVALNDMSIFLHERESTLIEKPSSKPVRKLPEPHDGSYKFFIPRTDPIEHLKDVWGDFLKKYTPSLDRNYLFQHQLGKYDPKLLKALKNKLRNEDINLSDIVPPIKSRYDEQEANKELTSPSEASRVSAALYRRRKSVDPAP